jgi:hypothetical protein
LSDQFRGVVEQGPCHGPFEGCPERGASREDTSHTKARLKARFKAVQMTDVRLARHVERRPATDGPSESAVKKAECERDTSNERPSRGGVLPAGQKGSLEERHHPKATTQHDGPSEDGVAEGEKRSSNDLASRGQRVPPLPEDRAERGPRSTRQRRDRRKALPRDRAEGLLKTVEKGPCDGRQSTAGSAAVRKSTSRARHEAPFQRGVSVGQQSRCDMRAGP